MPYLTVRVSHSSAFWPVAFGYFDFVFHSLCTWGAIGSLTVVLVRCFWRDARDKSVLRNMPCLTKNVLLQCISTVFSPDACTCSLSFISPYISTSLRLENMYLQILESSDLLK